MKRPLITFLLPLAVLLFAGCKKELKNGGISFSFISNQPSHTYNSFSATLYEPQYGNPVISFTSPKTDDLRMTGITPGAYHWRVSVYFTAPQQSGSIGFEGDVIIEKGKVMHYTLEY